MSPPGQGDITFNYSGDGGPALDAQFAASGLAIDGGNIYVSDQQNNAKRLLRQTTGRIENDFK